MRGALGTDFFIYSVHENVNSLPFSSSIFGCLRKLFFDRSLVCMPEMVEVLSPMVPSSKMMTRFLCLLRSVPLEPKWRNGNVVRFLGFRRRLGKDNGEAFQVGHGLVREMSKMFVLC